MPPPTLNYEEPQMPSMPSMPSIPSIPRVPLRPPQISHAIPRRVSRDVA